MSLFHASLTPTVLAALISTSVFASETRFDCETTENEKSVVMSFTLLDINRGKTIEARKNGAGDYADQSPISFWFKKPGGVRWQYPKNPYNFIRAAALNGGDSSAFFLGKDSFGRTVLVKDASDSCVSAILVLYKNTGFRRGYLRSENHCDPTGKEKSYSKVACELL